MVVGAEADDCSCGKAASTSLGFGDCGWGVGCASLVLWLGEQGPLTRKPDTHLSRSSQGQCSSGQRCSGGIVVGVGILLPGLWGVAGWGLG